MKFVDDDDDDDDDDWKDGGGPIFGKNRRQALARGHGHTTPKTRIFRLLVLIYRPRMDGRLSSRNLECSGYISVACLLIHDENWQAIFSIFNLCNIARPSLQQLSYCITFNFTFVFTQLLLLWGSPEWQLSGVIAHVWWWWWWNNDLSHRQTHRTTILCVSLLESNNSIMLAFTDRYVAMR